MKKMFFIVLATLFACTSIIAQEEDNKKEEKKKGGLMSKVKKGIESNTGLRVSDETLFVYPTVGEWKLTLEECVGNKETGIVIIKLKVTKLMNGQLMSSWCILKEAVVTGTKEQLALERRSAEPLNDFKINTPVDITLAAIGGVPEDAKTLDVKFYIQYEANTFEARRIPIEWE